MLFLILYYVFSFISRASRRSSTMERNARTQLNFFDIVAAEKKHPLSRDQLIRCGLDPPLRALELMYSQFLDYYTRQQKN